MKKTVIFLLLIATGWSIMNGQTGQPCAKYDQNRDISGMREILMMDGVFYRNLCTSYAEAINYAIGKRVVAPTTGGMECLLKNTILFDNSFVIPSDYENGVRFGDEINFTHLTGQLSDKWAAFRYEGKDYIYAKVSCMNPQKLKKVESPYETKVKQPTEQQEEPPKVVTRPNTSPDHGITIVINNYNGQTRERRVETSVVEQYGPYYNPVWLDYEPRYYRPMYGRSRYCGTRYAFH